MKKILILIIMVTLPLIAYFEYMRYMKFHAPHDYDYKTSVEIDVNYHDYALVDEYFTKSSQIGLFARKAWKNQNIDVLYPNAESDEETSAANEYNRLISRVKYLEAKLTASSQLKSKGFNNEEVQMIEQGLSISGVRHLDIKQELINAELGDEGEHIWILQKTLSNKGLAHKIDGLFGTETQNALITFQTNHDLYPSGTVSERTFKALFAK